jgi:hypothetical protein
MTDIGDAESARIDAMASRSTKLSSIGMIKVLATKCDYGPSVDDYVVMVGGQSLKNA